MSDERDDVVLKALGIGWVYAEKNTGDSGPGSDAAYIEKAIAIQKAQARVVEAARQLVEYVEFNKRKRTRGEVSSAKEDRDRLRGHRRAFVLVGKPVHPHGRSSGGRLNPREYVKI